MSEPDCEFFVTAEGKAVYVDEHSNVVAEELDDGTIRQYLDNDE